MYFKRVAKIQSFYENKIIFKKYYAQLIKSSNLDFILIVFGAEYLLWLF